MWMTSLAMVPLWLASGSVGTAYEAGLRAEVRTRASGDGPAANLELVPQLGLEHTRETLTLGLRYAPRLLLALDPGEAVGSPDVLHQGSLDAAWQLSPISLVRAREQASFGVNQFDPLAAGALAPQAGEAPLQPVPGSAVSRYVSSDSTLAWERALSLRARLQLAAHYQLSGPLGEAAASGAALPFQHTPSADARLSYELTRRDALDTLAAASQTRSSNGERAQTLGVTEGWRRQLTRQLDSQVALGLAGVRSEAASRARTTRALPLASADLGYVSPLGAQPLTTRLSARYAPVVDRLSGQVAGRAEAALALAWAPLAVLQLGTRAGAARTVDPAAQERVRLASLEAGATYQPRPGVQLGAGVRGAWEGRTPQGGEAAVPGAALPGSRRFEAGGFLTLTLLAREEL